MPYFLFLVIFFNACTSVQKKTELGDQPNLPVQINNEIIQGPSTEEMTAPIEQFGPNSLSEKPIHLILPAAGAFGFSYAGVLKELSNENIKINGITASEMGALISAIYLTSLSINEFEWKLQKLKPEKFILKQSMMSVFSKKLSDNSDIEKLLNEYFGNTRLEDLSPKLKIYIYSIKDRKSVLIQSGLLKEVLLVSLSIPNWIEPRIFQGELFQASNQNPNMYSDLQLDNDTVALPVTFLVKNLENTKKETSILASFYQEAQKYTLTNERSLLIKIESNELLWTDYQKRSELIFIGTKALNQSLEKIK